MYSVIVLRPERKVNKITQNESFGLNLLLTQAEKQNSQSIKIHSISNMYNEFCKKDMMKKVMEGLYLKDSSFWP